MRTLIPPQPIVAATAAKRETLFEYVLEAEFAVYSSVSDVEERPWGAILVAPDYPAVHDANLAWVDEVPAGGISGVLLELDEAMRAQGISFRRLEFSDPKAARAVQKDLAELGFHMGRALAHVRVQHRAPARNPDLEVREADTPEEWAVVDTILGEIHAEEGLTPEVSQALIERYHDRAPVLGERAYLGLLGGEGAGLVTLVPREKLGLLERVGTRKAFRRQGVAETLIEEAWSRSQALGLPHCGVITTWDNEPAKALYASLGFRTVGEIRSFHKG